MGSIAALKYSMLEQRYELIVYHDGLKFYYVKTPLELYLKLAYLLNCPIPGILPEYDVYV